MKTYHLFLSHSWKYDNQYARLTVLLQQTPYFQFKNFSVPASNPIVGAQTDRQLEQAIEAKIRQSSVVIILAGVYATYSKWINKEIAIAQRLGKPIIAVSPWGANRISVPVQEAADEIVGWNSQTLVQAIRKVT